MSEKQFDDIEQKICEAAGIEPPFNELAWKQMEKLLDQEKDRRRPFLWILMLVIFISALGGYLISGSFNKDNETADLGPKHDVRTKNNQVQSETADIQPQISIDKNSSAPVGTQMPSISESTNTENAKWNSTLIFSNRKKTGMVSDKRSDFSILSDVITSAFDQKKDIRLTNQGVTRVSIEGSSPVANEEINVSAGDMGKEKNLDISLEDSLGLIGKPNATQKITDRLKDSLSGQNKLLVQEKKEGEKDKKRKSSRFYISATIGAEASNVKLLSFKNSTVTAKYGLGLGFHLSKRLSIETGFSVSKKKYIAGPEDYKLKPSPYWNTAKIIKVDAACLVYEIPLAIKYVVVQRPKTSYFASTGLSTYFMKSEDYDFKYTRYNNYYERKYSYSGNKNLFSILTISGGVERKLTPQISMQLEPSVNIPLTGIGDGQVKLYSMGASVGLKYRPLKRR